ncbi:hypothetical protein [Paracoccus suum]|nr:hypothetical protein [Paracoccus suum]
MQTYTYRLGESAEPITMRQDDGTPYDLSGCSVQIAVETGPTCLIVPVQIPDPLLGTIMPDTAVLDTLTPRARRASIHITWSEGSKDSSPDFALNIVEAC